ncbi:MAG: hypothetical protein QM516_02115 [Limnohabitans sp.]|nr:hypothetical protein [Limnohabitans sp.]
MANHASHDESGQMDDPEMGSTWFYSFVGIIFFIAFCLAVSVLFFGVQRDFVDERVVDEKPALAAGVKLSQQSLLGQYGTYAEDVDEKKVERIRIPIDRAMEIMAKGATTKQGE